MPARKKTPQTRKAAPSKRKQGSAAAATSGRITPYGVPIRDAIARGDLREMKALAASTRKWLKDVGAALAQLESSVKKSGA
jgi:hypothetical protein